MFVDGALDALRLTGFQDAVRGVAVRPRAVHDGAWIGIPGVDWGIVGEDGSRYELDEEPPPNLAQAGLMVTAEVEPSHEITIRQWGKPVTLVRMNLVEE